VEGWCEQNQRESEGSSVAKYVSHVDSVTARL
jgi:hypothetical protein